MKAMLIRYFRGLWPGFPAAMLFAAAAYAVTLFRESLGMVVLIQTVAACVYLPAYGAVQQDQSSGFELYALTMPIKSGTLALSRYLFALLFCMPVCAACAVLFAAFMPELFGRAAVSIAAGVGEGTLIMAVSVPVACSCGAGAVSAALASGLYGGLTVIVLDASDRPGGLAVTMCLAACLALALSIPTSIGMYGDRSFYQSGQGK